MNEATPAQRNLILYLHQQFPSTQGNIELYRLVAACSACTCEFRIHTAFPDIVPSGGHDFIDEICGLLRVTREQRDLCERLHSKATPQFIPINQPLNNPPSNAPDPGRPLGSVPCEKKKQINTSTGDW